jgi:hypothetical protein
VPMRQHMRLLLHTASVRAWWLASTGASSADRNLCGRIWPGPSRGSIPSHWRCSLQQRLLWEAAALRTCMVALRDDSVNVQHSIPREC